MKKGASLYYASDKNIFDALNQSKVDNDTVQELFRRRNIVSSKQTKREELARFFSRLTHDFADHKDLADRLGIVPKRERVTSIDLIGKVVQQDVLQRAVDTVKNRLNALGDVVNVGVDGSVLSVSVKYTIIDYRKSEFSQLQHRRGLVELRPEKGRLVIRSTKSDYLDDVRDELAREIQKEVGDELKRREISLFHHPEHEHRSRFFYELMTNLPGYVRRDVTDVFVFKPRPELADADDEESDPHIDRIFLRGRGVSQSELLRDLTKEKEYYIAKVGWIATSALGAGSKYEMEAMFSDPKECTGFSYLLKGVYDLGSAPGKFLKYRRSPTAEEVDSIAKTIESKAREIVETLDGGQLTEPDA